MSPSSKSSSAVGSESSKISRHPVALRLFYTVIIAIFGAALLPVIPAGAAPKISSTPSAYTPVVPVRIMDTRSAGGALGAGATRDLVVTGASPLAPAGATAVVLNVTVTNTTDPSFLTIYPAGSARPLASNLNWLGGTTVPNLVEVPTGTGGAITFYNLAGTVDVIADLEGYFTTPSGSAGGEVALTPARITDTRSGSGYPNAGATLGPGGSLDVQVTGQGGVPGTGVSGVILNATVTNTTAPSFLTVWPTGSPRNLVSNLNWMTGMTIPNRVFVPVGTGGKVSVYSPSGSTDVILDVGGYFTDSTATGAAFTPQSPVRIADTRGIATLGPGGTYTLQVGGVAGVPGNAKAVILNVTTTNTTAPSFLTVYPSTATRPFASDLNWLAGVTRPNLTVATLGTTGAVSFYSPSGNVDVVVDLFGYFGGTVVGPAATVDVTAVPSTLAADGTSTSTVTATVKDASLNPVPGDTVTFTLTPSVAGSCGPLSATTGTTDASGKVVTTYTASAVVGTCAVKATEAGGKNGTATITQTRPVNNVAVKCTTPASADATPATCTLPANGTSNFTIKATVTHPVTGVAQASDPVAFTVTGASCGAISGASTMTDTFGVATATYTASTTVKDCIVTVTEANTSGSGTVTVHQVIAPDTVTIVCAPSTLPAAIANSAACTVNVKDFSAANVANQQLTLTQNGTPPLACGPISSISNGGKTNASGNVTFTYTATTTPGFCDIKATEVGGTGASGSTTITQTKFPAPANYTITIQCSTDSGVTWVGACSVPADGTSSVALRATVTGVAAAPVSGDAVHWDVTGPAGCGTVGTAGSVTGSDGIATNSFTAGLTVTGGCVVTAKEAGTAQSASLTITQTAVPNTITLAVNPKTIPANGTSTSQVTATVKDGVTGAPVAGDIVNFAMSANPAGACGAIPATGTTLANGTVTVTYLSSTTAGFCKITGSDASTGSGTATITQTTLLPPPDAPYSVSVMTVHPENGLALATLPAKRDALFVVAQVLNNVGKPVVGDPVDFSISGAGCDIDQITGDTTPSAMTTSHGKARAEYGSAEVAGTCVITVQEANASASGSATVTNTAALNTITVDNVGTEDGYGFPGNFDACSVRSSGNWACRMTTSPTGGTPNIVQLTFLVSQSDDGPPVANDPITFTLTGNPAGACGTMVNATNGGMTGGTGLMTVSYVASTTSGNCVLVATETNTGQRTDFAEAPMVITQTASSTPPTRYLHFSCTKGATTTPCANISEFAGHFSTVGDGSSTIKITATVCSTNTDPCTGTPEASDPINFNLDDMAAECGSLSPLATTTDANGKGSTVYTPVKFHGHEFSNTTIECDLQVVEAVGATATLRSPALDQTIPGNTIAVTCAPSCTLPANGTSTATITATVTDGLLSTPVVGDLIDFTTSGGTTCGAITPTSTTNVAGNAVATYASSATAGFCTLTATDGTAKNYKDVNSNFSSGSGGSSTSPTGTVQITQTTPPAPRRSY